ncbi:MAG: zinc-finger domain-containing protein [Legionella sp.]
MSEFQSQPACAEKSYQVHYHQLPLSCPTDSMALWNAHPKVYLPIETSGKATCPYCGSHFILQND